MKQRVLVVATAVLLGAAGAALAQEPPHAAELEFVRRLRERGDADLALEYLQRLGKNPSPQLAEELPLELARTRLVGAAAEPDTTKRLALFRQVRAEFEKFLAKNPNHPRAAEAKVDIAQVSVQQGKTQLNKALMDGSLDEGLVARRLLEEAGKDLDAVAADLNAQLKALPEPKTDADKTRRTRLQDAVLQAEFGKALNLYDLSQTYMDLDRNEVRRERGDVTDKAREAFEAIANKDYATAPGKSIAWQALAWQGRCLQETKPKDARKLFDRIVGLPATQAGVADGRRLARYFLLELNRLDPAAGEKDPVGTVEQGARAWLRDYPSYRSSPEGYGVRYRLAEALVAQTERTKPPMTADARTKALNEARQQLKEIEHSENEFTDRARRLKIDLMDKQGGFSKDIAQLKTFEDCYARSQYEMYMTAKDARTIKDPKELEKKIKERREAAVKALESGLQKDDARPDASGKYPPDVNSARLSLAYNYLNAGKYKDAIRTAEALVKGDHRTAQAPTAAAYAMQAHAQYLTEREQKAASKDDVKGDRDNLLAFANYLEEAWPDGLPGNLARHQVGLLLLRNKQPQEAIRKLATVTPAYPSYALVRLQIAEAALQADRDKLEPIKDGKLGSYHDIAVKALEGIPDSTLGPDPTMNHVFFVARVRQAQEMFRAKKYPEMRQLIEPLLQKLPAARLAAEEERNNQLHAELANSLNDILLYSRWGLADGAFRAGKPDEVLKLLDPVIDDINADKLPSLKNDKQLAGALLGMTLKANVQLGKLERTKDILKAMSKASEADNTATLRQMVELIRDQVDELRKKDDKDKLKKTVTLFASVLDDMDKQQPKKTPEFSWQLATNYSHLGKHEKAAAILEKVEPPTATGNKEADDRAEKVYHTIRVAYIHELRLSGDAAKAKQLLDEVIGPPGKPGWGANHVEAQLEQVQLYEEAGEYVKGAKLADAWVNRLKKQADSDPVVREKYLEFYYHTAYCFLKHGQGLKEKDKAKGERTIKEAAAQIAALEKNWKGFGSDASTKRFTELLAKESELNELYEKIKNK